MLLIPQNPAQFFKQIWIQENRSITPLGVIRDKKKKGRGQGDSCHSSSYHRKSENGDYTPFCLRIRRVTSFGVVERMAPFIQVLRNNGSENLERTMREMGFEIYPREIRAFRAPGTARQKPSPGLI